MVKKLPSTVNRTSKAMIPATISNATADESMSCSRKTLEMIANVRFQPDTKKGSQQVIERGHLRRRLEYCHPRRKTCGRAKRKPSPQGYIGPKGGKEHVVIWMPVECLSGSGVPPEGSAGAGFGTVEHPV